MMTQEVAPRVGGRRLTKSMARQLDQAPFAEVPELIGRLNIGLKPRRHTWLLGRNDDGELVVTKLPTKPAHHRVPVHVTPTPQVCEKTYEALDEDWQVFRFFGVPALDHAEVDGVPIRIEYETHCGPRRARHEKNCPQHQPLLPENWQNQVRPQIAQTIHDLEITRERLADAKNLPLLIL